MIDVVVVMVDFGMVYVVDYLCYCFDQCVFELWWWRMFVLVLGEYFEVYGWCQFFGDDEGMLLCWIVVVFVVGDCGYGCYVGFVQVLDGLLFLVCVEYWEFGGEQVFGDFVLVDVMVDFDEVVMFVDFGVQGVVFFQFVVDFVLQCFYCFEWVVFVLQVFEWFFQYQFYEVFLRIRLVVCCGMLQRLV